MKRTEEIDGQRAETDDRDSLNTKELAKQGVARTREAEKEKNREHDPRRKEKMA